MKSLNRSRLRLTGILATVAALSPSSFAWADVVLHPGTIEATTGLSGWSFDQGYASISGNSGGFSSTVNYSGDSFSMTIEGNQTYSYVYTKDYKYTSNGYVYFYQNSNNAAIAVPANGSVAVNLRSAGGTIVAHVAVTGGTVVSSSYNTSAQNSNTSVSSSAQGYNDADVALPALAGVSNTLTGSVKINVSDGNGGVLCTTQLGLDAQSITVAEGATGTASYTLTVGPSSCQSGLAGTVGVNNAPGGVQPTGGYVSTYSYANGTYLGSLFQSFTGNNQTYAFTGLAHGTYYTQAITYFPNSSYLQLPSQDPSYVEVTATSGTVQRDFLFDGSVIKGNVQLSGPYANQLQSGYLSFGGTYDYTQPNYGPAAGGHAQAQVDSTTGAYVANITPGTWNLFSLGVSFTPAATGVQTYNYLNVYNSVASTTVTAGQTVDIGSKTLATSSGVIVFDVIEPAGATTVGISNPYVYASRYDNATGEYIQAQAYAYVQAAASPSVRIIGVPGTYTFQAYATVNGSQTQFAQSTITLGEATDTPVGTHVVVVPKDGDGNPSAVTLNFTTVTTGGSTTISVTDVGPAAPPGSTLIKAIDNKEYINVNSSALFPDQVEVCISYDPTALGLSSAQEAALKLQEYTCDNASNCAWQVINGTIDGRPNPDTTAHVICGMTTSLSTFALTLSADNCPGVDNADQLDTDGDGDGDACDPDIDNDGVLNVSDNCPLLANPDQANLGTDSVGDACDDDDDHDGALDTVDNCLSTANADQMDSDGDSVGDACDGDSDGDGVANAPDNCAFVPNADQANIDGDALGDACDNDNDDDGVVDLGDNCPLTLNADQADLDGDHLGDACDSDVDGDGVSNAADSCANLANADQTNTDGDALGDACDSDDDDDGVIDGNDNCRLIDNASQANNDLDARGDVCDDDDDNDTISDANDNCVFVANADQADTDGDALGDSCDLDLDGDGVSNTQDNCPSVGSANQADVDGDGIGDACDTDIDGDGIANAVDNCIIVPNASQSNLDADLLGDACDTDIDGDGKLNTDDNCITVSNANQVDNDNDGTGDACDADDDNDGIADASDNCQFAANTNQMNFDGDAQGDACDANDDNDGVLDGVDLCASTPLGSIVHPANGCSVPQLCPCAGPRGQTLAWKNHGQYVSCVSQSTNSLAALGLMTSTQKGAVQSAAGQSSCGVK